MTTFWDSIKAEVKAYPVKVESLTLDNVWDSVPEQSLAELSSDCVHHFSIPTGAREVIGQCSKCNGERWFKNYYEESKFNKQTTAEQIQALSDIKQTGEDIVIDSVLEGGIA